MKHFNVKALTQEERNLFSKLFKIALNPTELK